MWLWGIGVRRLIGQLRKRHPDPMLVVERWGGAASAEELVLLGTEHGDLAGALDGLSPELRAACALAASITSFARLSTADLRVRGCHSIHCSLSQRRAQA